MRKELGKIKSVTFGYGGYQDAMFGISFTFSGEGWGVSTGKHMWAIDMECSKNCKWSEEDRSKKFDEIVRYINQLMIDAKIRDINRLRGIPIEARFEGQTIKSWRILTEVL